MECGDLSPSSGDPDGRCKDPSALEEAEATVFMTDFCAEALWLLDGYENVAKDGLPQELLRQAGQQCLRIIDRKE